MFKQKIKNIITKIIITIIVLISLNSALKFTDINNINQILFSLALAIIAVLLIMDIILELIEYKTKSKERNPIFIRIILTMLLVTLCIFSTTKTINRITFQQQSEITTAEVYEVTKEHSRAGRRAITLCHTRIKYYIDEVEYENSVGHTYCVYKKNDKITIYYNPSKPTDIRTIPLWILIIVNISCYLSLVIYLIFVKKHKK